MHNPPNTSNRASEIGSKNWEFKNLRVNFCLIVAKGEKKMLLKIRRCEKLRISKKPGFRSILLQITKKNNYLQCVFHSDGKWE